ncbi:family 43 glycosylhydrolase, partial [Faecalimonas umbilicata]|nr:family 43 glycosylhydrolase [Faecalimonas umbilicata]
RCMIDFEIAPATTGRAGTFAFNQSMVYWNTTDQDGKFADYNVGGLGLSTANTWKMVTMTLTGDEIAFYSNGQKINHTVSSGSEDLATLLAELTGNSDMTPEDGTKIRLGASMAKYWIGAGALLDDISFFGKALTAAEVAQLYDETATSELATGITISSDDATVNVDKTMQLTATLEPSGATGASMVSWKSSNEKVATVDRNGLLTALAAGTTTITASIGGLVSNELTITVESIPDIDSLEEGYYLAVYTTTTPFYTGNYSNTDQETQSVYFAVSKDGKTFDVLNNGGGVIFAKEGTLKITEPKVFKENGTFTVIARDADKSQGYHEFTSTDGVNFYDESMMSKASQTSGVLTPSSFKLMLDGENLLDTDTNLTLGNAVELTEKEYTYIVNKLGTVVNNGLEALEDKTIRAGDTLTEEDLAESYPTATATYTDGSTQNFNIDWSGALDGVDLSAEGTYTVTGKVVQTKYLNNLKELNGSTLPEDDPDNENTDYPTNYDPDTKTVYYDETKFVEGMADPFIFWDEQTGYYYMTGSYFPEDGDEIDASDNCQQYDRVVLRRGKTLEELQDRSKQVTIWKVGNQGYEDRNGTQQSRGYRYIWAPEIHRVGDNWVVYFTESQNSRSLFGIYCHALVLPGDQDPYETALKASNEASQWKDYQMRGGTGLTNAIVNSFCLDMTYFKDEVNGESYVIWASTAYGNSSLYMAKVNEEKPYELTSNIVLLTQPEYGWERIRNIVNEGATVLQKDGTIYLCFSVSGTGSMYSIGMLTAEGGSDLLADGAWTKTPYPLLTSRDVSGEEGPGHNSFTVDKDGNVIFVYHARPTSHNYQMCGWDGTKSTYNSEPLNDPC